MVMNPLPASVPRLGLLSVQWRLRSRFVAPPEAVGRPSEQAHRSPSSRRATNRYSEVARLSLAVTRSAKRLAYEGWRIHRLPSCNGSTPSSNAASVASWTSSSTAATRGGSGRHATRLRRDSSAARGITRYPRLGHGAPVSMPCVAGGDISPSPTLPRAHLFQGRETTHAPVQVGRRARRGDDHRRRRGRRCCANAPAIHRLSGEGRNDCQSRYRDDAAQPCKPNETLISWNSQGPQGQPGPQGDPGAQGEQGEPGPAGPPGDSAGGGGASVIAYPWGAFDGDDCGTEWDTMGGITDQPRQCGDGEPSPASLVGIIPSGTFQLNPGDYPDGAVVSVRFTSQNHVQDEGVAELCIRLVDAETLQPIVESELCTSDESWHQTVPVALGAEPRTIGIQARQPNAVYQPEPEGEGGDWRSPVQVTTAYLEVRWNVAPPPAEHTVTSRPRRAPTSASLLKVTTTETLGTAVAPAR